MTEPRQKRQQLAVGACWERTVVAELKRTQIVQYAGASGDYNPLHTDEIFATEVAGFPSVFAHGMLTMGLTATAATETLGVENLASLGGRFKAQVWPGDTLTTTVVVEQAGDGNESEVRLALSTTNAAGDVVFEGYATTRVATPSA